MRVLIAMDSFKGSLGAKEACQAAADGLLAADARFEVDIMPIADGGEGFVSVLADATGGEVICGACHDPLGRVMSAPFLRMPDGAAAIEMAAASGLTLISPGERDIMRSTTFGTGEQLLEAIMSGARRVYIGLGGSATCDGGMGLMRALGARFLDADGRELRVPAELEHLERVELDAMFKALQGVRGVAACDVDSPLTGPRGAAHVFGPQKGASPEQVLKLDAALERLSRCMREAGCDMECAGAGAAGGLGGALHAMGFELRPGIDAVLEMTGAAERMRASELVIVGEGMTDSQTAAGKAPCGVSRLARDMGRTAVCISGGLGSGIEELYGAGVTAAFAAVKRPMTVETAMADAYGLLRASALNVGRLWMAARDGMQPELRPLTQQDKPKVMAALATCSSDRAQPWTDDEDEYPGCMIAGDLASGRAMGLFKDGELMSYAVLELDADEEYSRVPGFDASVPAATIHRLFTAGRAQGRGMGARMVELMAERARREGAGQLCVDVYDRVAGLMSFYGKLGFEIAGDFVRDDVDGMFTLMTRRL